MSGVQSINVRSIANEVFFGFNTFKVDGYDINFHARNFKVSTPGGETLYASSFPGAEDTAKLLGIRDGFEKFMLNNRDGFKTYGRVVSLSERLLSAQAKNHYSTKFAEDVMYDFVNFSESEESWPGLFASVVNEYQNRQNDVMVISGSFAKRIVDKFKTAIGAENVTAINVIRNPSAAYLCNYRPADFYDENPGERESHEKRLRLSLLNAAYLKKDDAIQTIKFEDIMQTGHFDILDRTVYLPGEYAPGNEFVTNYERRDIQSDQGLAEFNQFYTNFKESAISTSNESNPEAIAAAALSLPNDIFSELGYTPLTYDQATKTL